jgi:hypothetical protein
MRRLVLSLAVLALATTPTFAADVAREEGVYVEGVPGSYEDDIGRGNALVASLIDGTFTDLGPAYQAALNNAGMTADLIYDPYGSWPPLDDYCLILVTTSDLWWTYNWGPDEAVLDGYMAAGGTIIFVGQDYIYSRGGIFGFPSDWLGVVYANEDLNYGDEELWWDGTPGGPLDGYVGQYISACFASNPFFTDEIGPAGDGVCWWTSLQVPFPVEGGSATMTSIFSVVEFGCMMQAEIDAVVYDMIVWLGMPTPAETTTWGSVKGMFR